MEISTNWSDDDRKNVVLDIAAKLHQHASHYGIVSRQRILDDMERIDLVLTKPAGFLEHNRKHILNGTPVIG